MPSKSKKQHNLMALVANDPKAAKRLGIPRSVGEEYMKADKGKKFASGGALKEVDSSENPGLSKLPTEVRNKMGYMKKGGMAKGYAKGGCATKSDAKMIAKKEVKGHEKSMHGMKKGGVAKTVTKEMEYDYKTGKKSFAGSTTKRDQHAEKEGKIVAKHLAYDKDMDKMAKGGRIASKGEHAVQKQSKRGAQMFAKGGIVEKGTGEKYASKVAMMKHEKKESKAEEMKEHGMKKGGMCGGKYARGGGIEKKGKTKGKII